MSKHTKIEWADHSWSPWRGCTKVSPGCANCYAETLSKRNPAVLGQWGKGAPRVLAKNWGDAVKWNRNAEPIAPAGTPNHLLPPRPRVFPSLCDWLDEEVPAEWLAEFLTLICDTPYLDWLLLTKRPENFRSRLEAVLASAPPNPRKTAAHSLAAGWLGGYFPNNVWFGVSVEDQIRADERIPLLLNIPAKVRWLSLEPLLGPVMLGTIENALLYYDGPQGLQWLVIGGESGHGARPCNVAWVRSLVTQCQDASVPVFVKQLGNCPIAPEVELWKASGQPDDWKPGSGLVPMKISHPKGGDPLEWPSDLRVRQFPNPTQ